MSVKKCVHCGHHDNGETCTNECSKIKLFGVRISVPDADPSSIRKCRSLDNLEAAEAAVDEPRGYLSDGFIHCHGSHKRKRGKPWSEEEHRSFLEGLEKLGKGTWKGIATEFVPSRKSSQVASHAQKHFNRLKLSVSNQKRRRASVFDMASGSAADSKNISKQKESMSHVKKPLPMQPYSWLPDFQARVAGLYPSEAVMPWVDNTKKLENFVQWLREACLQHGNFELAEVTGKKVLELDPDDDVVYVLLFSMNDRIYLSKNR
ncbi:putative transcription factor [Salvia divinorum]|uniref:Transcription factor n=1 Tax=Salvia divinorum TaxID=28513 RepID=A0ABD1HTU3_SALDI